MPATGPLRPIEPPPEATPVDPRDRVTGMWMMVVAVVSVMSAMTLVALAAFMVSAFGGVLTVGIELLLLGVCLGAGAVRLLR